MLSPLLLCVAAAFTGGAVWLAICAVASIVSAIVIGFRFRAATASFRNVDSNEPICLSDANLPHYTVIAPLYRESEVVGKLVKALAALDYPAAKIEVKLVIEDGDMQTRAAIEALELPQRFETVVAPAGGPQTKPRALNVALARARGSLIVVFDAEDSPEPGQLRLAAEHFAAANARLACLQARLAIDNTGDGWLTALFGIEYAALFDVLNPGLAAIGAPILLGGTSNHFRTSALRRVCGWDAWNVTEDADLGLRLARFGYTVETIASTTHEEAPARLGPWLLQRRRWVKGWIQTLIVHGRTPARLLRELGLSGAIAAFSLLLSGIAGPLLAPVFVIALAHDAIWGDLFAPANLLDAIWSMVWAGLAVAGLGSILLMAALGARRRHLRTEARYLVALPVYYALITIAAWGALWDFWRRPFAWSKTEHGLAKTSRRRGIVESAGL